MAHIRKTIRDQLVTTLTGLTTTGANVTMGRVHAVAVGNLPGLFIYSGPEEIIRETMATPAQQERQFTIYIEAIDNDASPQTTENTLDTILKEIEVVLGADVTLNSKVRDHWLQAVEINRQGDQERAVLVMKMEYVFEYRTAEGSPEALT